MSARDFAIGDKVRLTGEGWTSTYVEPNRGDVVEITGFEEGSGYPTFGDGWGIYRNWEAELVEDKPEFTDESGLPAVENTGLQRLGQKTRLFMGGKDVTATLDTEPKPDYPHPQGDFHPNFVQVYLQPDSTWDECTESMSAYRNHGEEWQIDVTAIYDQDDIDLMRLLLDEIEDRLIQEAEKLLGKE